MKTILICAGGSYLPSAWVLISALARLGSKTPIELWSLAGELNDAWIDLLAPRAQLRQGCASSGWELKAEALSRTSADEVMLLDADVVPVRNPDFLFEDEGYRDAGALFWPDTQSLRADCPIWGELKVPYKAMPAFETGQLIVRKSQHPAALALLAHLNEHSARFYQHVYGDKDTFLLAWLGTESAYSLMPHAPFHSGGFMGQKDRTGELIFQHRYGAKWALAGNPHVPYFQDEEACVRSLAGLPESPSILYPKIRPTRNHYEPTRRAA